MATYVQIFIKPKRYTMGNVIKFFTELELFNNARSLTGFVVLNYLFLWNN